MFLSITVDVDDPFFGGAGGMRVLWNFFSVSVFCKVFMPQSAFPNFKAVKMNPSNMDMSLVVKLIEVLFVP